MVEKITESYTKIDSFALLSVSMGQEIDPHLNCFIAIMNFICNEKVNSASDFNENFFKTFNVPRAYFSMVQGAQRCYQV